MEIKLQHKRKVDFWLTFGVSEATVESWVEQIKELCKGYDLRDMDEKNCFFNTLPAKKGYSLQLNY